MKLSEKQLTDCPLGKSKSSNEQQFVLEEFLPYEIRSFYTRIAESVAATYERKYGITPAEWRVLATIGSHKNTTSAHIVSHANTDKVTVSRALAKLTEKRWVKVSTSKSDRRRKGLTLTATGRRNYNKIVPEVLGVERSLLAGVSRRDIATLRRIMKQIESNAKDSR